jgi:hypothetical protein
MGNFELNTKRPVLTSSRKSPSRLNSALCLVISKLQPEPNSPSSSPQPSPFACSHPHYQTICSSHPCSVTHWLVPPCNFPLLFFWLSLFPTHAPVHSCYNLSLFWAFVPAHCPFVFPLTYLLANSDSLRYFSFHCIM